MRIETRKGFRWGWSLLLLLGALVAACGGSAPTSTTTSQSQSTSTSGGNYKLNMVPLVSNVEGVAAHRDGKMVDAWGLEFGHKGRIWVNNSNGYSTVYDGNGNRVMIDDGTGKQVPLAVQITAPNDPEGDAGVGLTGMVFNEDKTAFKGDSFIFADESGTLAGWAEAMKNTSMSRVDNSGKGAVYKGLTMAKTAP